MSLLKLRCLKRLVKIYIKITIAPTCFGVITIIRKHTVCACYSYSVKTVGLPNVGAIVGLSLVCCAVLCVVSCVL